jgi:probable phosphoglycerate mutase
MRRRLYLMRHAEVSYWSDDGTPRNPAEVSLNDEGRAQAHLVAAALDGIEFDFVVTSGLPRTLETAAIVAPGTDAESWPELREIQGGRLSEIPADALEREFVHAFRGVIPNDERFLRGESIGELFDRTLPALERIVANASWHTALAVLHGGVNRAVLSYALTGERMFLGHFEQAPACVNVLDLGDGGEWIVRAVNIAPYDLFHLSHRSTTMERYWSQYRALVDSEPT